MVTEYGEDAGVQPSLPPIPIGIGYGVGVESRRGLEAIPIPIGIGYGSDGVSRMAKLVLSDTDR